MRFRSPIEQMVDRACGITDAELAAVPAAPPTLKDPVRLFCPCGDEIEVEREPDFFDYDEIETECPKCRKDGTA